MSTISLGDLAQTFMLRRQNVTLKADIQRLTTEITTGNAADASEKVSGDFTSLAGIDSSLARLEGYKANTTEAALLASGMQTALDTVGRVTSELGSSLLLAATTRDATQIGAIGADARQRLETAVGAFNTRLGSRSLFSGEATDQTSLISATSLMAEVEAAATGARTAEEVNTAVKAWFNDPNGYLAKAYTGGDPRGPISVAPSETTTIDVTAADPAIRDTLQGLALAALLDRGVLAGQIEARADLARLAGESLSASQGARAGLASRLGTMEGQIDDAASRNSAEKSALQIARSDIMSVDQYETNAMLEATQSQIETLYELTARISRLSLVDYLR